ncbi:unnamed protein product [Schistosoma curassoni]|uniref:ribose-5-phosphate isomerase n=1 Tax=Schistosoma curassoni TaxID=6186 RepID=A0A183K7G2_9TREM|nr:unnamed protein product [Schistosoma curassoni]
MTKSDALESAKQIACNSAISDWLKDNQIIGLGSGTTIKYAVEYIGNFDRISINLKLLYFLADKVKKENLQIQCIPTSFQIDVTFDGADEVDEHLHLIKGGGGCLLQEKIVASCTKDFIAIVDERQKLGSYWTKGLPIEVVPMAFKPVQTRIQKLFGGQAILREAVSKMGPVVTDNGNFLLDWKFDTTKQYYWPDVNVQLSQIPGIVDTGLFINMTSRIYIGNLNGTVTKLEGKSSNQHTLNNISNF